MQLQFEDGALRPSIVTPSFWAYAMENRVMRPTAEQVAVLLIAMVRRVGGKRGEGSRWRFSAKTLRKIGRRVNLRSAFLEDLDEELATLGYFLINLPTDHFGLIQTSAFDSWPSISLRGRLDEELKALKSGNQKEFEELVESARRDHTQTLENDDDED